MNQKVNFHLNGELQEVECESSKPLLWVLREDLSRTGTKFGCGRGLCGACSVLIDGKPVRSCITLVSSLEGKHVTTVEGLAIDGLHPVQQAWVDHNVPQCGYCQPGQIINAVALLDNIPKPSDEDIDSHMAGLVCRCGTYQRIRAAIHDAANARQSSNQQPVRKAQTTNKKGNG